MDDRKKADELKQRLVEIDHEILRALERRARVAHDLGRLRTGTARYAPLAEGAHLQALERAVQAPFPANEVRPIFTQIDNACRRYEVMPHVAFLGAEGGFGWAAARNHFGAGADLVRVDSTTAALDEVARSRADFAVVPYESLKEGPIFSTIQAIAAADLKLVGERELTQTLALVSRSGDLDRIEKIFVAPQDHILCMHYIESNHPRALVIDVRSPVAALDAAAESDTCAAIVPQGTIGASDLRIARENIGDEGEVRIRYAIVSRLPAPRSGNDATALLFGVHDRPGALHDVLLHFKERNCSLRKIQSHPVPGERWEYMFYVEVSGHMTDRPLVAALEGVKREAKMLKIVGSFPLEFADPTPAETSSEAHKRR